MADTPLMSNPRISRWLSSNSLLVAMGVLVMGGVIGSGLVIGSVAKREDPLREAEVRTAELATHAETVRGYAIYLVGRGDASAEDALGSRVVTDNANRAADRLRAVWSTDLARRIVAETDAVTFLSRGLTGLVRDGRLRAASRRLDAVLVSSSALNEDLRGARGRLKREIDDVQDGTLIAILGTGGVAGAVLVALVLAVTVLRRRRAREEAEQEALRSSERRLQALVRHGSDMVTVVGPDTTVLYEAGAVRAMLGFEPEELEGSKLTDWLHADDIPELLALCASANGSTQARELRFRHRDGSLRVCEARATSLLGDGDWDGIVLNIWDVSERKALEERLRHQAFHDDLTGLANRALFGDRLSHALARGARRGDGFTVTVLLIDLDDFKSINDSFGHLAGDRLLTTVAERLDGALRAADTVARLGGDEFGVILDDNASEATDVETARRVLAAIERPFEVDGRAFPISASVGIARQASGQATAEQLIRNADLAMYAAKAKGTNDYCVFRPDMHIATEERLQLKADLAQAVAAGGQLELYYQPVVSLSSGAITGVEALLRWNHPTRGLVGPDDFVPLAEESGAITVIGRWVLREACRRGKRWNDRVGEQLLIGVNVSARQLVSEHLFDDVQGALAESGLEADRLVLEVTESQLMRNIDRAIEVLEKVKRLGVRVAIDDFGTGYSSLSQLERLPVDILKVDREFAGGSRDGTEHAKLLRAVMEIGESLRLSTIAEGIETPEHLAELRSLDFPLGQGFLFSRPVPGAELDALLAEGSDRVISAAQPPSEQRSGPTASANA